MSQKNISVKLDEKLLDKLKAMAKLEMRSVSGQVMILIRDAVYKYEKEHGELFQGYEP